MIMKYRTLMSYQHVGDVAPACRPKQIPAATTAEATPTSITTIKKTPTSIATVKTVDKDQH